MRVAYDLDDTSGDATSGILEFFNKRFGYNHSIESVVADQEGGSYDFGKDILMQLYNVASKQVIDIFRHESQFILPFINPLGGALIHARNAYNMGADIYYITARSESYEDMSSEWLTKNHFPKGELICREDKDVVAKQLGINWFFEDNIRNITQLLKVGVQCFMVDALCNHSIDIQGVQRVHWNTKIAEARANYVAPEVSGLTSLNSPMTRELREA
jgi:hypothetical protein